MSNRGTTDDSSTPADRCGASVDVLVCNAGVQGPTGPIGAIGDADGERVPAVNLCSAMSLTARAAPCARGGAMKAERGGGRIVRMSSIAGLRGNRPIRLDGLSKAALAQLARNLAIEWGRTGCASTPCRRA